MSKEDIFRILMSNVCEVVPEVEGREVKTNEKLADLGANSVDRAEIVMMTLESLSLRIPLVSVAGAKNIGELVDVLYEKLQSN